jgi:3-oxoadipate enol-lactonase
METIVHRIPVDPGVRLYVEETGTGPALVLIHGLTLDHRMWADQIAAFAVSHRVLACDLRGFGLSDPALPDQRYSHAADLKTLLDHLGIERATLVGLSMGGWPAVDFALAYPEATAALILVDSTLYGYAFEPGYGGRLQALFDTWPRDPSAARAAWLADPLFGGSHGNPATVARLTQMVEECNAFQLTQPYADPHIQPAVPVIDRLGEITAPTLIIVGRADIPDFHHIGRILHESIPGSRYQILENAGHMCNMDDPTTFNASVLSFLADHPT